MESSRLSQFESLRYPHPCNLDSYHYFLSLCLPIMTDETITSTSDGPPKGVEAAAKSAIDQEEDATLQMEEGSVEMEKTTATVTTSASSDEAPWMMTCLQHRCAKILAIVALIGLITGIFIWATDGEFCDFGLGGGDDGDGESSGYTGGYNGEAGRRV